MLGRPVYFLVAVSVLSFGVLQAQDKSKTDKSKLIEYKGKKLPPDKFRRAATRTNYGALASVEEKKVGSAVLIEGQIDEVKEGAWTITMEKNRNEMGKVEIDLSAVGKTKARTGCKVRIAGVQTKGKAKDQPPEVKAYLYEFVIPIDWKYVVRNPEVRTGRPDFYYVDVTVKNTGKQPIDSVTFTGELYRANAPSYFIFGTAAVTSLKPGETKTIAMSFENVYDWIQSKNAQMPVCSLAITDYQMVE